MSWLGKTACAVGLHRMEVVRHTGLHSYVRCERCGRRRILALGDPKYPSGYQPVDAKWLETGEFGRTLGPPPGRGSGVVHPSDRAS